MSIVKNDIDITQATIDSVKLLAEIWRFNCDNFKSSKILLLHAKDALDSTPRPWMEDCVYDAIQKINEALEVLK